MSDKPLDTNEGNKKVTLKDVAKRANVSYATVSRTLNQIEDRFISESTRKLVLAAAAEMGYQPNRQARSLVTRRNLTIGVVFPSLGKDVMMSPFIHQALNGVLNAAEERRQDILLLSAADRNRSDGRPEEVIDSRIDGLIFIAPPVDSFAMPITERKEMPYAVIGGSSAGSGMTFNIDNRGGVRQALEHLVSLGHRRIAHISGMQHQTDGIERLAAFREFMAEAEFPLPDEYLVSGNFHIEPGADAATQLLRLAEPPTAIFCANDGTAFGVIQAAHALGLSVPGDLSVVGFDDHYLSPVFRPPLTTVRQPLDAMGAAAVRALVDAANGKPGPKNHLFPAELVIRSTTQSPKED